MSQYHTSTSLPKLNSCTIICASIKGGIYTIHRQKCQDLRQFKFFPRLDGTDVWLGAPTHVWVPFVQVSFVRVY